VSGSFINSRTSLIVKAAWTGPRRPTIRIFLMRLSANRSNAQLVMSVLRSRPTSVSNIRATSRATFPCPMIIASSPEVRSGFRSRCSGNPLYQPTNARAEYIFLMSPSPSSPSVRSFEAPYANTIASWCRVKRGRGRSCPRVMLPMKLKRLSWATSENVSWQFCNQSQQVAGHMLNSYPP
jgi:hypothetical protein